MTNEVQKWGDLQQYMAETFGEVDPDKGVQPKVTLLWMTPDPLGAMAAMTAIYSGKVVRGLGEVTDDERRKCLEDVQKTHLKAPLEVIKMHFLIEGVDRAFTHQHVRQRTAVYGQESMRFAVLGDLLDATTLPPSLAGTKRDTGCPMCGGTGQVPQWDGCGCGPGVKHIADCGRRPPMVQCPNGWHLTDDLQRQRNEWDECIRHIDRVYHRLVDGGMPAEEARGLLPHCTATRIHYTTDLRNLSDHAGNRLCTQAQFHWRKVFNDIVGQIARHPHECGEAYVQPFQEWQYEAIAASGIFRPACYQLGYCPFDASFDRKCSIRERVQANASIGRPSRDWHTAHNPLDNVGIVTPAIPAINPAEWLLNPDAAREH